MPRYNPALVEPKWQARWEAEQTFAAPRLPGARAAKLYVLDMFPYPSGDGLHVGHPEGYTATDIVCRFERMRGKAVLHPMGFDAFGLPAEEHAIKTGTPPRIGTERNIANFRRQLKSLGFSYDWQRELATTDPDYFRWTQWIFLELYDTWFDSAAQKGRPIRELPVPAEIAAAGDDVIARYQDEHRLAYEHEAPVNWCPALGTVLANEEVVGGLSEVGGHPVVRLPLRQWMLRITAYADRLEHDLELVDWPASIKKLQRDWIGRSTGAEVDFFVGESRNRDGKPAVADFESWKSARGKSDYPAKPPVDVLRIFTTRPDTLFGATYMVIAPEHPLVARLTGPENAEAVKAYVDKAATKSDLDRTELAKTKTGVFSGSYAINPVDAQPVPIWIADYVLASYGTGAIMAVPAHDERDFEFAKTFGLPIVQVVAPLTPLPAIHEEIASLQSAFVGEGAAINSGAYDGLSTAEVKEKIAANLARGGLGRVAVNTKLRDWLFSRQRFWGEPFPILHEVDAAGKPTGRRITVPAGELPVNLPELADFKPIGRPEPPLEKAPPDWLYVTRDGRRYKRETNTMPQWAGSCWYYLRFIDNRNDRALVDPQLERAWMPVDLYIGGAEHAVLHLLYARFWHKVLFDRGHVSMPEPFRKLVNQGMILGEMEFTGYRKEEGGWLSAADVRLDADNKPVERKSGRPAKPVRVEASVVEKQGEFFVLTADPSIRVDSRAYKMSKSRGNVVNPDRVVKEYGADSLRLYEMFMGPLEATKPWSMTGVNGVRGFLDRVWRMIVAERSESLELNPAVQPIAATPEQNRLLHKTIAAVTRDIERLDFNTAIARMMEFTNFFTKADVRPREIMESFVLLLSPFAPHLAEELWELLDHKKSLAYEPWPAADADWLREDTIELPVQINGKVRARIQAPTGSDSAALEALARADAKIAEQLDGKTVVKVVVIPSRMVSFVVK
ncbi:MAG TPA: leucine--tRNA ligase [Pirellulales bacterium]|nr:leucine--tRNA ligase [Pirellulales bacterium]